MVAIRCNIAGVRTATKGANAGEKEKTANADIVESPARRRACTRIRAIKN